MTKKLIAILLTLCLLLGMTAAAFAEEITYPGGTFIDQEDTDGTLDTDDELDTNSTSLEVRAVLKNTDAADDPIVYNVELIWGNMLWAWGNDGGYTYWDPVDHVEITVGNTVNGWYLLSDETLSVTYNANRDFGDGETKSATVTDLGEQSDLLVFNHSNAPVDVKVTVDDSTASDQDVVISNGDTTTEADDTTGLTKSLSAAASAADATTAAAAAAIIYDKNAGHATSFTAKPTKEYTGEGEDKPSLSEEESNATSIATLTIVLSEPTDANG